jgi:tricorn protease
LTAPRFSLRHLLLLVPVVLLLGGAIWWLVIKQRSESPTRSPASWQIKEVMNWASTPGEVYSLGSFSPDAQMIAFASTESGTKNIWLKQTTQEKGNAKQITDDEFKNDNPIWSPNGQEIAFFSLRGNHSGIWTMPLLGGTPTEITQLDDASVKLRYWSKRKKIYYEVKSNLFTVDLNSKQIIQITNFDASMQNISAINISPDEERIAYVSIDENGSGSLWVMQQQNGSAVQVISDTSEIRNPVWHPDGKQLLYSADVGGTYQIFIASPDSRKPEQITFGDRDALALDVAADGTKILFGSSKEEADVWGINIAEPEKDFNIASGMNSELWPDVAPDSKLVTFQSVKNLSQGDKLMTGTIMTKTINSKEQPVELVTNGFLPTWSPDGKQLAFMRLSGDRYGLYTIKASGGEAKLLTTDLPPIDNTLLPYNRYQVSYFSWSPDSSKIVYGSARNQRRNLWTVYADGSNETQITDNEDADSYLYCPLWSADSKQIAYTSKTNKVGQDGRFTFSASVIDLATKEVKLVFQAKTFLRLLGWSDDEKALIFATTNSATISGSPSEIILLQVAIATGEQRIIATLQSAYLHNIHLSSDRRMLAFVSHKDDRDNIQMISVSGGEAKRLTANNDSRLYFSSLAWSPDGKTIFFGKQSRYSLLSMMTNFK